MRRPRSIAIAVAALSLAASGLAFGSRTPRVLRVGTFKGIRGTYSTVQAAVNAAAPGDWILVGPGDYKEVGAGNKESAGVLIAKRRIHLRGMNRRAVVIDGTKPGSPVCSRRKSDQIFTEHGRNGVVALEVDGVSIENLTVCNYLTGNSGGEGNEIWWNGGDGSGKIGMGSFLGRYITATSTYANGFDNPRGEYGIFTSNARGPGVIDRAYASNMGDAAFYIGACPDCHQLLIHSLGEHSSLGFSGTNAGGHLKIAYNVFRDNKTGAAPDSQNNDDAPSPLSGKCPNPAEVDQLSGTNSCTVWFNNLFVDNNNPNVPGSGVNGLAGGAPVGTGLVLAGNEYVTVLGNRFQNNKSWGLLIADLPDQEDPPSELGQNCQGGIPVLPSGTPAGSAICYFQSFGNDTRDNVFTDNGGYGNPTNGDIGMATALHNPGNCFHGNYDTKSAVTADPSIVLLQSPLYTCSTPNGGDMGLLAAEALCSTQLIAPCPTLPGATYPRPDVSKLVLPLPTPREVPVMPYPCAGVPTNPWCP